MSEIKRHPFSKAFEAHDLSGEELTALGQDIFQNGLRHPITLFNGEILDGWNRYVACAQVGADPIFEDYDGDDPAGFVLSQNVHRRHLTPIHRAGALLRIVELQRDMGEGSERSILNARQIEAQIGVSRGTAHKIATIAEADDKKLSEAVIAQDLSLEAAAGVAKVPVAERPAALQKAVSERKNGKRREHAPAKPEPGADELADELEAAHKELRAANALIESLKSSDHGKEIAEWESKYRAISGRLEQTLSTLKEAKSQARYAQDLLAKIRRALGLTKNTEILEEISHLKGE